MNLCAESGLSNVNRWYLSPSVQLVWCTLVSDTQFALAQTQTLVCLPSWVYLPVWSVSLALSSLLWSIHFLFQELWLALFAEFNFHLKFLLSKKKSTDIHLQTVFKSLWVFLAGLQRKPFPDCPHSSAFLLSPPGVLAPPSRSFNRN